MLVEGPTVSLVWRSGLLIVSAKLPHMLWRLAKAGRTRELTLSEAHASPCEQFIFAVLECIKTWTRRTLRRVWAGSFSKNSQLW